MGIFVDWLNISFKELSNKPINIIIADIHTLVIENIIICNKGEQDIRINLEKVSTRVPQQDSIKVFLLSNFEVKGRSSINLIDIIGKQTLRFSITPAIMDHLVCYTNGYTQKYDCDISYFQLNELPITP